MILLFIVFCPLVAAGLILAGLPARPTALWSAGLTLLAAAATYFGLDSQGGFSHVTSLQMSE